MRYSPPIPHNEMERILNLSDFDLDYSELQEKFKDLTKLAAFVAGTEVSLINLIDSFTQWTVANFGHINDQTPREDSVCQYTIVAEKNFEVKDLSADERFKDKNYVKGDPNFRYYFGIPLVTSGGYNLGALCVLDKVGKEISPEKVELLSSIADEIVNRIVAMKVIEGLRNSVKEASHTQKKVAHDIRGPIGGIISLSQMISEQGDKNKMEQVLEFIKLIQQSGNSLLELAEDILDADQEKAIIANELNLTSFKNKLEQLYTLQAVNKNIDFVVNADVANENISFPRSKLLQIAGNLISNALKFTPPGGQVIVDLSLVMEAGQKQLCIIVTDTGIGLNENSVNAILQGNATSTDGTNKEKGYGFGLTLVKHLIDSQKGSIQIRSIPDTGTVFEVKLPQK